ncbi:asparagine synthase (glutamine-hydrolyzing) [Aggregatimonas sangjinii]|uniref:asparagine synthase (glutamine-hydrolyzing) n=1 Tax=Aggregatimonas sangjinii TaxID=2583587 RepID=A0A5B7SLZ2_9FLAO|nr:asparagine synthase (glutamine-hydrolyzing) [Aggregatimonas sangjinii]QCW99654.1 asparagine synthase (glutamine-hydrolyzing) [Aggregatimonas sangjinii]
MCGINGFIKKQNVDLATIEKQLHAMNDSIVHRGPDDDGTFFDIQDNMAIAMGMRRLSIIDLASGKQPISSDDGQLTIVFNGEIYNYQILRQELIEKGVPFQTHSDTEVILKLYEKYGEDSFTRLDGMFAFSIHDKKKNKILIARDFFGEKPLYYTDTDKQFIWASELKSIVNDLDHRPEISRTGLNHFFRLSYIPAPHSIYKDIKKLEANHYIAYDLATLKFEIKEIAFEVDYAPKKISWNSAKDKTRQLVQESVQSRSISDVPLGTFLSGGVDSSIVSLALSQMKETKIETFSIGFEKASFDETDKSRLVAKLIDSKHHEFVIGEDDLSENIHEIILNFDEPFSDAAALPTYLVSKKTRDYVKVALTGDGGDEVFGGYNKYYVGKLNTKYTNLVPKSMHGFLQNVSGSILSTKDDKRGKRFKIKKMLNSIDYDGQYYWDIISLANTKEQLTKLLKTDFLESDLFQEYKDKISISKPGSLHEYRQVDQVLSLEGGMLPKVDRTSMLNSLECRAPFLNKQIWRFTAQLPDNYLMKGWNKKYILKEAFKKDFPDEFLEKSKQGFNIPVGDWLRSSLRAELESFIDVAFLESQNIFNVENCLALVKDHLSNKRDSTYSVWAFYCFQKWYRHTYLSLT